MSTSPQVLSSHFDRNTSRRKGGPLSAATKTQDDEDEDDTIVKDELWTCTAHYAALLMRTGCPAFPVIVVSCTQT
ncbi:hypothetical protein SCP_0212580 [Sparassis crispa]|uniref:Uncharacterized protein n=1 Tax=Sparassis crispa TaxID=139825 RepID=A0A401GCZ5_9APHY|nr:hypothetical protein SCP_0212580 [Sparassis crispa]GBE80056.1 hypothetical protein SCP_0212580 [Sparassis crispa]